MEKISKNLYKGELITNPMEIERLANEKRSVFCNNCWGLSPAAILINFPLFIIIRAIHNKDLYYTHK